MALLAVTACGDKDDDTPSAEVTTSVSVSLSAEAPTTLAPCKEDRHAVAFDVATMLTTSPQAMYDWIEDPADVPPPRPGAAELTLAYRRQGYEVIYVTAAPTTLLIGGRPLVDAASDWLLDNGFAVGDGTRVLGLAPTEPARGEVLGISDLLVVERSRNVYVDYGYSDSPDRILAFQTGGIAPERVFSLNVAAGAHNSTQIPGDDLAAEAERVQSRPKVCE